MAEKEQERQAIQKIRKIVEGMGENSYLATAMEGVLETAEENIEYDAAFSLKGRAEAAEKEVSELKKENEELRKTLKDVRKQAAEMHSELLGCTLPDWMKQELEKLVQAGLERVKQEIRDAADGMAYAIGELDGERANQEAAEQAKRYKESREEQITLNRVQGFLRR